MEIKDIPNVEETSDTDTETLTPVSECECEVENDQMSQQNPAEEYHNIAESDYAVRIKEFVTKALNIADCAHSDQSNNSECQSSEYVLKDRIKCLEEGVKTLSTICGVKDIQLELHSHEVQAYEARITDLQSQVCNVILQCYTISVCCYCYNAS